MRDPAGMRRGSAKKSLLGIIDPGFVLQPGEKMRMCTGNPATQAHGSPPPEDAVKNYFLFLPKPYLSGGAGTDIVDYSGSIGAISIHLADDGHASGAPGTFNNPAAGTIGGGDATGDTLTGKLVVESVENGVATMTVTTTNQNGVVVFAGQATGTVG